MDFPNIQRIQPNDFFPAKIPVNNQLLFCSDAINVAVTMAQTISRAEGTILGTNC
jgi:hypothetical protein